MLDDRRLTLRTRRPGAPDRRWLLAPLSARPVIGARADAGTAAWLAGIVVLSALVRAVISVGAVSPWVLPDELVYSDLARSIAAGGRPAVRGVPAFGWGEVYPTLIAPVWALVDDRYVAYHAALAVGAVLMSLAAVPAYLLARLFVSRTPSLLVAALTVLAPSLSYTGALLTENAFYPLFILALYAICHAVRRPTAGTQAFAVLVLGLVVFTRIQGAALILGYAGAILAYAATGPPGRVRAYLLRFAPTAAVAVPVAAAPLVASVARGDGPFGWLGGRSGTFDALRLSEVPQWFVYLAAGLVLYVAVVPAVATAVVAGTGLSRRAAEPLRLFAAVAVPTIASTLLSVAFVSASVHVDQVGNLNERYVFFLVPLAFLGLALWIEQGLPRPRPWGSIALAAACVAPALLPVHELDYNAGLQALALVPWHVLASSPLATAALIGTITTCFGLLWLTCTSRTTWRLWALVSVWMALLGLFAIESNRVSASKTAAAFEGLPATWVDDALPPGADVAVVWDENRARPDLPDSFYFWLMVTEFFNRSVGDVYRLGPATFYENLLPTVPADMGPGGRLIDALGRPVTAEYALVTCRTPIAGEVIGRAPHDALRLVRVDGPLRLAGHRCRRAQP